MTIAEETWIAAMKDLGDERQRQQERAEAAEAERDDFAQRLLRAESMLESDAEWEQVAWRWRYVFQPKPERLQWHLIPLEAGPDEKGADGMIFEGLFVRCVGKEGGSGGS